MYNHRGSELQNVSETWQENERNPDRGVQPHPVRFDVADDLQDTIREEADEYDHGSKEEQLLGGDRASINDE
ncbi:hypothetical protein [Flaviaesturariibacter terrae]